MVDEGCVPVVAGIGWPAGNAPGAGASAGGSVVVSELGFGVVVVLVLVTGAAPNVGFTV